MIRTVPMSVVAVVLAAFAFCAPGIAQDQKQLKELNEKSEDAFQEAETGQLTLRFLNALTGGPVPEAQVEVLGLGTFTTDAEGKVLIPAPEVDTIYAVSFRAPKFLPADFEVEIMAGTLFFNRFSVSPVMDLSHVRVVLDWGREPRDLDLHFLREGGYHISFRDMRTVEDGSGQLDLDDMDGEGPETITVTKISHQARYRCFVHDYTNRGNRGSGALARSRATVKVYGQGRLLKMLEIPTDLPGDMWEAFRFDGGRLVPASVR